MPHKSGNKSIIILGLLFFIVFGLAASYLFQTVRSDKNKPIPFSEIPSQAQKIATNCQNSASNQFQDCYKKELASLTKEKGFNFAQKTLYALQDIDPRTKSCHIIAHFMAREAQAEGPNSWQQLVDTIDVNACGSGFLHGVLEAKLAFDPNLKIDGNLADQTCDNGNDQYRQRMCNHFMGHLFLVDSTSNLNKALPVCKSVKTQFTYDCLDGLFMENAQKIALVEHGLAPEPNYTQDYLNSLESACSKYQNIEADACWTEIAEPTAKTFGYDPNKIYQECQRAQTPNSRWICYQKGGTIIVSYPLDPSIDTLKAICKPYQTEESQYKSCTANLISTLFYYSTKLTPRGIAICQNIQILNSWCFGELGNRLKEFVPSLAERETLCQETPQEYKKLCLNS